MDKKQPTQIPQKVHSKNQVSLKKVVKEVNYYDRLGVSKSSSCAEIKRAYHRLAIQYHPDKGGDELFFKTLVEAAAVLTDEQKRLNYDTPVVSALFHRQRGRIEEIGVPITLEHIMCGGMVKLASLTREIQLQIPKGCRPNDLLAHANLLQPNRFPYQHFIAKLQRHSMYWADFSSASSSSSNLFVVVTVPLLTALKIHTPFPLQSLDGHVHQLRSPVILSPTKILYWPNHGLPKQHSLSNPKHHSPSNSKQHSPSDSKQSFNSNNKEFRSGDLFLRFEIQFPDQLDTQFLTGLNTPQPSVQPSATVEDNLATSFLLVEATPNQLQHLPEWFIPSKTINLNE